jgi:MoxR-like ATPase
MVDVAADNIQLRILQENIPGLGYHFPVHLVDDDAVLGLHPAVKDNMVWIWVSKKVDYDMWNFLEHIIDRSSTRKERLDNEDIMIDTMLAVEYNWLNFVSTNLEVITDVLDYTLAVWLEGGQKENFMRQEYESDTKNDIAQKLEMRKLQFESLRMTVIQRRVHFETETNISNRENRLHELYFNGNDPRSI